MTLLEIGQRLPLVEEIPACRMLTVNPYTACDIRCAYCVTGAQGVSRPRVDGDPERLRRQLRRELEATGPRQPAVGLGTLADAYPGVEAELGVTRVVLAELIALGWAVKIVTKGITVPRDLDLLLAGRVRVEVSLSTTDAVALARLEPGAAPPVERLSVIHELHEAGVPVSVSACPWIPGVADLVSLTERLDPGIRVVAAPLNVRAPEVARTGFGRRFDQAEVDRAYLAERDRLSHLEQVAWLPTIGSRGPGNHEQVMVPLRGASAGVPAHVPSGGSAAVDVCGR